MPATEREYRDLYRRIEPMVLSLRERGTLDHFDVAMYYSERGDRDLAFAALQRAVDNRSPGIASLVSDPRFDALRNDPRYRRFAALIK